MRTHRRLGALVLVASLGFTASSVARADETPDTKRDAVTTTGLAVINVEGMT